MGLFGYDYRIIDFKQMMLAQSDGKKRKGTNKNPHTNNYKQKIKNKRGKRR